MQSIESDNVESVDLYKDEADNYSDISWNGRSINPKFNESTVETVRNAILNTSFISEREEEGILEEYQLSTRASYSVSAGPTVVTSGRLESIKTMQESGYIPCGERCHGEYTFDLDVNKEGVDAELDVGVENEDGDTSFSAGAKAHTDYEGNTEYSGHVRYTKEF